MTDLPESLPESHVNPTSEHPLLAPVDPSDPSQKPILKYTYNKNKGKMPRRNKSAFILFSIETRARFKAQGFENVNSNDMMVRLADLWKNLPTDERQKFQSEADRDKMRYLQELDQFWKANPSEMIQNKTKKNHVKKPCSAYALYLRDVKHEIKDQNPNLKMADVLKIVSERWKQLEKNAKQEYETRAEKEKEKAMAKLEEKVSKNDVDHEIVLKKKKARQRNEIRKQIKADGGQSIPLVQPNHLLPSLYPHLDHQKSLEKLLNSQNPSLQTTKSTNDSLSIKDDFLPQLSAFSAQNLFRSFHSNPSQLLTNPLLEAQKSLALMSLFPPREPSLQETRNNLLLQLLDKSVRTSSDYLVDLLSFSSQQNSSRLNSSMLFHNNSNPFPSSMGLVNKPVATKPSRAQVFNSAILSALDMKEENDNDIVKKEEEDANPTAAILNNLPKL